MAAWEYFIVFCHYKASRLISLSFSELVDAMTLGKDFMIHLY
jgi:hypothetical protein